MLDPGARNVQRNRILHALSNADLALLQPHLEQVPLGFRQCLQVSNRQISNVYFPESTLPPSLRWVVASFAEPKSPLSAGIA